MSGWIALCGLGGVALMVIALVMSDRDEAAREERKTERALGLTSAERDALNGNGDLRQAAEGRRQRGAAASREVLPRRCADPGCEHEQRAHNPRKAPSPCLVLSCGCTAYIDPARRTG